MKTPVRKSTISKEFSRFAYSYATYNIIQRKVAKELISKLTQKRYEKIVDIGCGDGTIYNHLKEHGIVSNKFVALDSSKNMLMLHPNHRTIEKYCIDFDEQNVFNNIEITDETLLLSSSSLQWSQDLNGLFLHLSNVSKQIHFSIFTSNTFKTLHKLADISSPIYSAERLKETITKYYDASFEIKTYKLHFKNVREMFQYIKKSGVSGGEKQLGFKQTKALMSTYQLDYLEFEVLFVTTVSPAKSE